MYEQGYQPQYPRRPSQGLSPFTRRVLLMLVVFVLLLPIANLLKGSNGHIVKATRPAGRRGQRRSPDHPIGDHHDGASCDRRGRQP